MSLPHKPSTSPPPPAEAPAGCRIAVGVADSPDHVAWVTPDVAIAVARNQITVTMADGHFKALKRPPA